MPKGLQGFQKGHGALRTKESYRNPDVRERISQATTQYMSVMENRLLQEKNPKWRGDDAGKEAVSLWMTAHYGRPKKCEYDGCTYPRKNRAGVVLRKPNMIFWALRYGCKHGHHRENYIGVCVSCYRKFYQSLSKENI